MSSLVSKLTPSVPLDKGYYAYRSQYGFDKVIDKQNEFFGYEQLRQIWDSLNVFHCVQGTNSISMICNQ